MTSADYGGWQGFGYGELGANLASGDASFQPFVALQGIHLHQGGFIERGDGSLNLAGNGHDTDSLRSLLGGRFRYQAPAGTWFRLVPELQASWLHEYGDASAAFNNRFAAIAGSGFVAQGLNAGRDWALFGAGVSLVVVEGVRLSGNYTAQTNARQTLHMGYGTLSIEW